MFKRSTYPEFVNDLDVQIAFCGHHHEECEERIRQGLPVEHMYPKELYKKARDKIEGSGN